MEEMKITQGEACYGLYLPAYTPEAMITLIPGSRDIIHGTAMSDYYKQPVSPDPNAPAVYFLPDKLFDGTSPTSGLYDVSHWALFKNSAIAANARNLLIQSAIQKYIAEIQTLEALL